MPTVTLKVTAEARQLWVEAATNQQLSLSEWLRQAAAARLGAGEPREPVSRGSGGAPDPSPAPSREASHPGPAETPHGPEETSRLDPTTKLGTENETAELLRAAKELLRGAPKP